MVFGWGIIFYCAFEQRELTVPSSLKIPLICNITLRKKIKSAVSIKLCFWPKRKKLQLCCGFVQQRFIDFPGVLCPQVLLHEHVCFTFPILSQGEKRKQCQGNGLAVVLRHNWDDFLVNHLSSHEWKYPSPTQKVGRHKERQGHPCYWLLPLTLETFCEWF